MFKSTARKHYWNPQALSVKDFEHDLRMFGSTAQSIDRYFDGDYTTIPARMILNRIIIIHNVFGRFTAAGLFYKTKQHRWKQLKTMLTFLKLLPLDCPQQSIEDDHQLIDILNTL